MENAPAVKTNEANLEELNRKIVEIKRKIVLKGEPLIILTSIFFRPWTPRQKRGESSDFNDFSSVLFMLSLSPLSKHSLPFRGSKEGKH